MAPSFRILLFISENDIRNRIIQCLSSKHYEIEQVLSEEQAVSKFLENPYNLVICEDNLQNTTGFRIFKKLENTIAKSNSAFFMVLRNYSREEVQFGLELGIDNFIFMPIDEMSLRNKVDKIYRKTLAFNYYETPRFHEEFKSSPIPMFFSEDSKIVKSNEAFTRLFLADHAEADSVHFHDLFDLNGHQLNHLKLRKLENGLIDHCWLDGVICKHEPSLKYNLYKSVVGRHNANRVLAILVDKCALVENGENNGVCPVYGTCLKVQAATQKLTDSEIRLTTRETEILHLSARGIPLKQIAAQCKISQRTVEKHRSNIMNKTNTHSMMEAVLKIQKHKIASSSN